MSPKTDTYSANEMEQWEYPKVIWKRPSMYLGERGTQQSVGVREILDNASHESLRGFATRIRVIFGKDGMVSVQDDGRGLPVDINTKTGKNGILLAMATLHAGANFSTKVATGKAGAGLNGVGASATNALSKRFDAIVFRSNKRYELSFQNGYAGHFAGEGPDAPFTPDTDIVESKDDRTASEKKLFKTGTLIRLWYNPDRFPNDESVDIDDLVNRLKYTAYIIPGFHIEVFDENRQYEDGSPYHWEFFSEGGLPELVEVVATDPVLAGTQTKGNRFSELGIQMIQTEGRYHEMAVENDRSVEVDRVATAQVAFRYGEGYEKKVLSFVNTIQTHLGGVHEKAFNKALVKAFGDRMTSMRGILTVKDEQPIIDDYFEGLTAILSINVPEPQFNGQQKDSLGGPDLEKALYAAFVEAFSKFANDPSNQNILRPIFTKVATAAKNRRAAADSKLAKRAANQISSSSMPPKLADCDITGAEESELLICEGDSAMGTVKKARDATFQAVIPIRGKILNCLKASDSDILKNTEVMDIAKALGAGFGKNFDIEKIRYGKVLFAADADVDGLQICNLLYTVFNRMFKPMLEEGRVYQTVPPLYEVKVGSGKNEQIFYAVNDPELNQIVKKLDAQGRKYKIDRNKGLGEMDAQAFSDTVLDPSKRTLRRITVEDAEKAEAALILTMDESSQDKKDFIGENFQIAVDTGLVEGFEGALEEEVSGLDELENELNEELDDASKLAQEVEV